MAGEAERSDEMRWLLEPPGAGDVRVFVELGEGAQLSEQAQQALDTLLREIQGAEAQGYSFSWGATQTRMPLQSLFQLRANIRTAADCGLGCAPGFGTGCPGLA